MVQGENEPTFGFDETRMRKNLTLDENSHQPPNLDYTSQDAHIEKTMEVQTQAQVNGVMEVQVHAPQS